MSIFNPGLVLRLSLLAFAAFLIPPMAAQEEIEAPSDVIWERDIVYSQVGGRVQMDVVRPREGTGPFPAVVCVHGGGFRAGTRQGYLPLAFQLAQKGYVAATVSYRLSPMAQFPAHVHDVKAAVRFLRANANRFQIDPDRIGAEVLSECVTQVVSGVGREHEHPVPVARRSECRAERERGLAHAPLTGVKQDAHVSARQAPG